MTPAVDDRPMTRDDIHDLRDAMLHVIDRSRESVLERIQLSDVNLNRRIDQLDMSAASAHRRITELQQTPTSRALTGSSGNGASKDTKSRQVTVWDVLLVASGVSVCFTLLKALGWHGGP